MTTPSCLLRPRAIPALLVLLALGCSWLTSFAQEAKRAFDIPAGKAEVTLKQFSEQAGTQFFFSAEKVSGVRTAPLQGTLAPREALEVMLKGTDLVAVQDEKTGALSVRRDTSPNAPRLAQKDSDQPTDKKSDIKDGVVVLDKFEVFGTKSINLDLPRTRDDAQPYVVFDRTQIAGSQATNLVDFFRTRLPMSSTVGLNTFTGNSAFVLNVNLRGLGTNQTLILVDGRRLPSFAIPGAFGSFPPDINGIPLAMVERIEVLPSTASGIYGGGATGGVINIITRKDYSGGEVTLTYANSFDTDVARRRADLNFSTSLRGGATMLTLTASWQEANALLTQDRDFAVRARQLAFANNPAAFTGTTTPPRGYTTNIRNRTTANLVLKPQYGGTTLSSFFTSVPVGYAGIASDNAAALVASAGRYNLGLPADQQGRLSNLATENTPLTSLGLSLRQRITPWLEGYADFQRNSNRSYNGPFLQNTATLPADAPNNPFTTAVNVAYAHTGLSAWPLNWSENIVTRVTGGLVAKLPGDWQAGLDYVWGQNAFQMHNNSPALGEAFDTAIATGALDVMRDLNVRPLAYGSYLVPNQSYDDRGKSLSRSLTVRASGPTIRLPAGPIMVSASAEWRKDWNPQAIASSPDPYSPSPALFFFPEISSKGESGYVEARVPLLAAADDKSKQARLELQLAGRYDSSSVTTQAQSGTPSIPSKAGPFPVVPMLTRDFSATSYTAGLRYEPMPDLVLRASFGTGFLAPDLSALRSPSISNNRFSSLIDRKRGGILASTGPLQLFNGGNPELRPEESESYSAGVVFTPRFWPGFRLSVDYTKIDKTDEITFLTQQQVLDYEDVLPAGSVVRAALTPADQAAGYTGGAITALRSVRYNFARREVEAVDFQADYTRKTSLGEFHGYAVATWNRRFAGQVVPQEPMTDQIGYWQGPLKWKGNAGLDWVRGPWSAGWSAQYYDSQRVYQFAARAASANTILTQGSDRWPAQVYHDLFASYQFGRQGEGWQRLLAGVKVSVGLQNIFNREPPLQAGTLEFNGFQAIEDPRLRRYTLTFKKHF